MWDDSVVETVNQSCRLLGKNVRINEITARRELYLFWHPQDIVEGLSYSVAMGSNHGVVEGHLPVFSSAPDWCKPVIIDPLSDVSELVIAAHKYNNDTDGFRVNLGCGDHVLSGWDNLDTESRAKGIVKPWQWNVKLPYSDQTVRTVVIQHSLQHCKPKDYDRNFDEIKRVLVPGGKIVVKEADNRYFVWHRPGQTDSDGLIASSTNEPEVLNILERNGFVDLSNDRQVIVDKYGEAINRTARLLRNNKLFIVEGTKPKET